MSKPPTRTTSQALRKDTSKVAAQKRGRWAETLVMWALRLSGHRILARNFKTPVGEVDLITKRGRLVRFIEVKARPDMAQALEAITAKQQSRVQRAAEQFLNQNPALQCCDVRFDAAVVTGPLKFHLLKDAWRP